MTEQYKVIIAHPGQQHSYHSAIALQEDLLFYVTTQYYKKGKNLTWLASLIVDEEIKNRIVKRQCLQIDGKVKIFCEGRSLLAKVGIQNKFPAFRKYISFYKKFGEKVAKVAIRSDADAVIMYDTTAADCFQYLEKKDKKIVKILDVTIGSRLYAKNLYEKEMINFNTDCFRKEYPDLWNPSILNRFAQEIKKADYAIAGSEYVKKTLIYSGMEAEKIFIVPYGTSRRTIRKKINKNFGKEKLELLFVGQINYRKGIHHLLNVVRRFDKSEIHLNIAGEIKKDNEFYLNYKNDERISFLGQISHEKIDEVYFKNDIFILPSLSEGMARVGIEALGCGLPIICTENTGVNDIINNGVNGFVIPVSNEDALFDKIKWFLMNTDKISRMSENAVKTASLYSWDNYYKNYHSVVRKIISDWKGINI